MQSLSERLRIEYHKYNNITSSHKKCEYYADMIEECLGVSKEKLRESIYEQIAYLYYYTDDVDSVELTLIPKLSELFEVKWTRDIQAESIIYTTNINDNNWTLSLTISASVSDESKCTIKQILTGKTKKVSRFVEIEVPDFMTVIECHED